MYPITWIDHCWYETRKKELLDKVANLRFKVGEQVKTAQDLELEDDTIIPKNTIGLVKHAGWVWFGKKPKFYIIVNFTLTESVQRVKLYFNECIKDIDHAQK